MEMDSLAGLGVSVRSQENLESEVMDQLEERMKVQEKETTVKQVKKEFPLLLQKLKICLRKKRSIEKDIQGLHDQSNQNGHQKRKIMSKEEVLNLFYPHRHREFYGEIEEHMVTAESIVLLLINKCDTVWNPELEIDTIDTFSQRSNLQKVHKSSD